MDKSKKYIKMCEEAFKDIGIIDDGLVPSSLEKIPNLWGFVLKDGSYCKLTQAIMPERGGWFQIYYQDQLQEMVNRSYHPFGLIFDVRDFIKEMPVCVISMEQLWLCFVMKEKYNKIWDDKNKKWIKVKE